MGDEVFRDRHAEAGSLDVIDRGGALPLEGVEDPGGKLPAHADDAAEGEPPDAEPGDRLFYGVMFICIHRAICVSPRFKSAIVLRKSGGYNKKHKVRRAIAQHQTYCSQHTPVGK